MRPLFLSLALAALACLATSCEATQAAKQHMPFSDGPEKILPESGTVSGLVRIGKIRQYRTSQMDQFLGEGAKLFASYGAKLLAVADYRFADPKKTASIECYEMDSPVAAAGIYHYYRGKFLRGRGAPAQIGTEAVLDQGRGNRNLYFYKQRHFFKVIYSGNEPVPDLMPLGRAIAGRVPGGDEKPRGFECLEVDGVDATSSYVTPGYTFNCDFLPPGIFAKAPGAGTQVAEAFVIAHSSDEDAERTARDYRTYLQINGTDYEASAFGKKRRACWQARDPSQGRVIFTVHRQYLVGVVRPQTYEAARPLLEAIVHRIGSGK